MNLMRLTHATAQRVCDLGSMKAPSAGKHARGAAALLLACALSLPAQTNEVAAHTPSTHPVPTATNNDATGPNAPAAGTPTHNERDAKPAATSGKLDFSSFKVVSERNIFNGNRSGQRMVSTRSSSQQRSVRVESFSLVGTLLTEGKPPVAFFDGSSSEFRKALKTGGNVAGFTVKEILHAGVRLTQGTNILEVRVGTSLRREDEGLWKSSAGATGYASSSGSSYSSSNGRSSRYSDRESRSESPSLDSPPAASADAAEILKRLMEKREKE